MLVSVVFMILIHYCSGQVGRWDVFTTKTAYPWSHNVSDPVIDAEYQITSGDLECTAATVYMVLRHGARYPTDGTTEEITELRAQLLNDTDGPSYENVLGWESSYNTQNQELLARFGEKEQFDIARRVGLKFLSLFDKYGRYTSFVSSTKARNTQSTEHFYEGLQNVTNSIADLDNNVNETLMRFYDGCTIYEEQVDDSDEHMKEVIKYMEMDDFVGVADKLKQKLGFSDRPSAGNAFCLFCLFCSCVCFCMYVIVFV